MDLKVIDNFLNENDFNMLINNTIGRNDGKQSEFRIVTDVGNFGVPVSYTHLTLPTIYSV